MYNRARTPAFVLGLFGGSVNAFFGIIALIVFISLSSALSQFSFGYDATPQLLFFIGIIIAFILNYIGALICIRRRTVGGVIMLITALLLLILTIITLINATENASSIPFGDYFGYSSPFTAFMSGGTVFIILWMIVELVSIIGAMLCFSPAGPAAYAPYGRLYGQPFGQPPYGQPYAQQPYAQPPYGQQNPYQQPYAQPPYGQPPQPENNVNPESK